MEGNERLTDEQLAEIRKRVEAATAGPWEYTFAIGIEIESTKGKVVADDDGVIRYPDAEFIAASRQDVPKLLAEIDELRAQIKGMDKYIDYISDKLRKVTADGNEKA